MIIYNVTIKVDKEVAGAWVEWMKAQHMPGLMDTGLFTGNRLCRLLDQDEADGITYSAQYICESIGHYEKYIQDHAQTLRDKAMMAFGGKFVAFRTVMEII